MLFGSLMTEKQSFELLDKYFLLGGRAIDTAQMYPVPCKEETLGLSEKIIGKWIQKKGDHKNLFISSKIAGKSHRLPFLNRTNQIYTEEHLSKEINNNLNRLNLTA